jgi:hypothetical protein
MSSTGTDANLLKEEARIKMKREANAARRERFMNARKRVMGIDVAALNAQVVEKKALVEAEKEADRYERVRQMEIESVLSQQSEEEKALRDYINNEVKKSWSESIEYKNSLVPEEDLDPLLAGVSAAQNFAGADPYRKTRVKSQKDQMRIWIQQQVAEKSSINDEKQAETDSYSSMLKAIAEVRDAADKEEKEMVQFLNDTVRDENFKLAAAKIGREKDEKASWKSLPVEERAAATSINLRDNEDIAMDENGRIVRKDQFRGYNAAQIRRVIQENEEFLAGKRGNQAATDADDANWNVQMQMQLQLMEQANAEEMALRKVELMHNLDVIKDQMSMQHTRKLQAEKDRYGTISSGFFDKFGMGCR